MHTQVICGEHFSLFYTQEGRSRLDVYAALQGKSRKEVGLAYTALAQAACSGQSKQKTSCIFEETFSLGQVLSMEELYAHFESVAIFEKTNQIMRSVIAGALAAGYYHRQYQVPIIEYMMTDDASEYKGLASNKHIHCWIHAIRHYRILNPANTYLRTVYEAFMDKLWDFYQNIKTYKELPQKKQGLGKKELLRQFDQLFDTPTDYEKLNKQMA